MSEKVKITIVGKKDGYYVKTLKNWLLYVKDIIEESLGKKVELEIVDSESEIPVIMINERKVFEGLPDNEGDLIEIVLSSTK